MTGEGTGMISHKPTGCSSKICNKPIVAQAMVESF